MTSAFKEHHINRLIELFKERDQVLSATAKTPGNNAKRNEAWHEIASILNAEGGDFSWLQVKNKWSNLKSSSKTAFQNYVKESRKTGGGPPPEPPNKAIQAMWDTVGSSKQFTGEDVYVETPIAKSIADLEADDFSPTAVKRPRLEDQPESGDKNSTSGNKRHSDDIHQLQKLTLKAQIESANAVTNACGAFQQMCQEFALSCSAMRLASESAITTFDKISNAVDEFRSVFVTHSDTHNQQGSAYTVVQLNPLQPDVNL